MSDISISGLSHRCPAREDHSLSELTIAGSAVTACLIFSHGVALKVPSPTASALKKNKRPSNSHGEKGMQTKATQAGANYSALLQDLRCALVPDRAD